MQDPRIETLAQVLVHHSCRLQSGQKVLIEAFDLPEPNLICRLVDEAYRVGITNEKVARHHKSFAASVKESGWVDEGRLAIESEGLTNVSGLMKLLPTAAKALMRGKAPIPYIHAKRPGADQIKKILEKGEADNK